MKVTVDGTTGLQTSGHTQFVCVRVYVCIPVYIFIWLYKIYTYAFKSTEHSTAKQFLH